MADSEAYTLACLNCTDRVRYYIIQPHAYIIIHDQYWIHKFKEALNTDDFYKLTAQQFVQMIAPLLHGLNELL